MSQQTLTQIALFAAELMVLLLSAVKQLPGQTSDRLA